MNHLEHLLENKKVFFNFMQQDYPIIQHSNVFFRDMQYAISSYFEMKEFPVKYAQADTIATDFINKLIVSGELTAIDNKSWKVNFEVGIIKIIKEAEGVENE